MKYIKRVIFILLSLVILTASAPAIPAKAQAVPPLPPGPTNPPITIDMGNITNAPPPWDTVNCATWRLNSSTGQLERLDSVNLGTWKLTNGELERFNSKAFKAGEQKASNSSYRYAANQNSLAMSPEFTFIMFLDYIKQFVDIAWGKDADFIEFIQPYYDCSEYSDAWKNLDANIYFAYVDYGLMKVGAYVDEAGNVLSKFYVKYSNKMDAAFTKIKEVLSRNLLDYIFVDDVERIDLPPAEIKVAITYHPLDETEYPPYDFETGRRLSADDLTGAIYSNFTWIYQYPEGHYGTGQFKIFMHKSTSSVTKSFIIFESATDKYWYVNISKQSQSHLGRMTRIAYVPCKFEKLIQLADSNSLASYVKTGDVANWSVNFGDTAWVKSTSQTYYFCKYDWTEYFSGDAVYFNNPYTVINVKDFSDIRNADVMKSLYETGSLPSVSGYRVANNGLTNTQPIADTTFNTDDLNEYNKAVQQAQQPASDPVTSPVTTPTTGSKPIEVPQPQPTETPKGSETGTDTETEPETDPVTEESWEIVYESDTEVIIREFDGENYVYRTMTKEEFYLSKYYTGSNVSGEGSEKIPEDSNKGVLECIEKNKVFYKQSINSYDCSEIAEDLMDSAGGIGKIYEISSNSGGLNILEYGIKEMFDYHTVYSDGKYVYDPRYNDIPILEEDYFNLLKELNPNDIIINIIS